MEKGLRSFEQNPFIVIWEMTRACCLNCLHCRDGANKERNPNELSFEDGIRLINEIAEIGDPILILTGGDVVLRPDFFVLAKYAIKKGLKVSVSSSATPNVTKDVMKRAKEIGISRWALNLDGPDSASFDALCGVPGTFDATLETIKYLKEFDLPRQINTVVSRYNFDKMHEMAQLVKSFDLALWNIIMHVPTGRNQEISGLTASEYELLFQWLYDFGKKASFDIKTMYGQHFRRVVIQNKMREQKLEYKSIEYTDALLKGNMGIKDQMGRALYGVNDGKGMLFVSHTGDVYPSGILPIKAGNVKEESFRVIYRYSPLFKKLKNPDLLKGKCGICEYRYICGGNRARAFAMTGDYLESEPLCVYTPKAAYYRSY